MMIHFKEDKLKITRYQKRDIYAVLLYIGYKNKKIYSL